MAASDGVPSDSVPASPVPPAERDRAVDVLTRCFSDDRLSEAELEARLDRVYRAATLADLHAVIADLQALPAPAKPAKPPAPAASRVPAVAPDTDASLVRAPLRISALLSGREQSLAGVVPDRVRIRARLAHIELDLSEATFETGVTVIDVRAFMGHVLVRLPANVRVESDGHGILGYFGMKGAGSSDAESPCVVRVTGRTIFGHAECHVVSVGGEAARIGTGTTE